MTSVEFSSVLAVQFDGNHYVFDGNTMLIARVPAIVHEAVQIGSGRPLRDWRSLVGERHGIEAVTDVDRTLHLMRIAGMLQPPALADLDASADAKKAFAKSGVLTAIQLAVTGVCNLRCEYCYADRGAFGAENLPSYIDRATCARALRDLLPKCGPSVEVALLGGEPFLHPHFADLLDCIAEEATAAGVRAIINVTTNGTVKIRPLVMEKLKALGVKVSVSIDGFAPIQDAVRPRCDGRGSFDEAIGTVAHLIECLGLNQTSVRVTCSRHNVSELTPFTEWVRNHFGPVRVEVSPVVVPSGHPCDLAGNMNQLLAARKRATEQEGRSAARGTKEEAAVRLSIDRVHRRERLLAKCEFGRSVVAVATDGTFYPCIAVVGRPDFAIGDSARGPVMTPFVESLTAATVLERSKCAECWAKFMCAGGCIAANTRFGSGPLRPTAGLCGMYRAFAEMSIYKFLALKGLADDNTEVKDALC